MTSLWPRRDLFVSFQSYYTTTYKAEQLQGLTPTGIMRIAFVRVMWHKRNIGGMQAFETCLGLVRVLLQLWSLSGIVLILKTELQKKHQWFTYCGAKYLITRAWHASPTFYHVAACFLAEDHLCWPSALLKYINNDKYRKLPLRTNNKHNAAVPDWMKH